MTGGAVPAAWVSAAPANGTSYGASPIKRRRRTGAQVNQLERQILAILEEDRPQSVRHVFYRLTDPRLSEPVEKSELGYRVVQNRVTVMRREGRVPYGWVGDATRRGYHTITYADGADFLSRHIDAYRADLWADGWPLRRGMDRKPVDRWCNRRHVQGIGGQPLSLRRLQLDHLRLRGSAADARRVWRLRSLHLAVDRWQGAGRRRAGDTCWPAAAQGCSHHLHRRP